VIKRIDMALQPEAVLGLQRLAYKIEAGLIGVSIPPLHESLEELQACGEDFHGFFDDGRLLGFISHKLEDNILDIHRVAVHPNAFRRGIAQQLLEFIFKLEPNATRAIVQTGSLNVPACRLYLKNGFTLLETRVVQPGLELTLFAKTLRGTM
jgi:ribosomal protein S18 acetylase RimI-like enzyme